LLPPWFRLRWGSPSKYESCVDLQPATWTQIKIVVEGEKARLYVHGNEQPSLIVNDVKSGPNQSGSVALWFEGSTIAHYANLKISKVSEAASHRNSVIEFVTSSLNPR